MTICLIISLTKLAIWIFITDFTHSLRGLYTQFKGTVFYESHFFQTLPNSAVSLAVYAACSFLSEMIGFEIKKMLVIQYDISNNSV